MQEFALRELLLEQLFGSEGCREADPVQVDDQVWERLWSLILQHRLAPYMHWRLRSGLLGLDVPDSIRQRLAAQYRSAALRSLQFQRELVQLHRILGEGGIEYVALKGANLAFAVYPEAALRPMRDLDLLVPGERLLDTFELLLRKGYLRPAYYSNDLVASMQYSKHLPSIRSPKNGINIELHQRLSDRFQAGDLRGYNASMVCETTIGGEAVKVLSATDNLLHLIVHAAYDHRFNNGPVIISDVLHLIESQTIDWSRFWRQAELDGLANGCHLLLQVVRGFSPDVPIEWPGRVPLAIPPAVVSEARQLTLRSFSRRSEVQLLSELASDRQSAVRAIKSRIFPPRAVIAAKYRLAVESRRVFAYYPLHWIWQLRHRVPASLGVLLQSDARLETRRIQALDRWMAN